MIAELRDITLFSIGDQPFCSFATSAFVDHVHVPAYSNAPHTSENLFKILTLSSEIESLFITLQRSNVNILNFNCFSSRQRQ
jgi:hypothetical protein